MRLNTCRLDGSLEANTTDANTAALVDSEPGYLKSAFAFRPRAFSTLYLTNSPKSNHGIKYLQRIDMPSMPKLYHS